MKKYWIKLKSGLGRDAKHRERMGNRVWLFLHMIDVADAETGMICDWQDRDEAESMSMPWRKLQQQRQALEALGYITCHRKEHSLDITINNWTNTNLED